MPRRRALLLLLALLATHTTVRGQLLEATALNEAIGIPTDSSVDLVQALVGEDLDRFDALLAAGSDPNQVDVITPLYAAQEYVRNSRRRHQVVRRLLKAGATPDTRTADGSTALMLAASNGDMRTAQLLLEHGADALAVNEMDYNSIDIAFSMRHDEVGELLKEHAGDVHEQRIDGIGMRWRPRGHQEQPRPPRPPPTQWRLERVSTSSTEKDEV